MVAMRVVSLAKLRVGTRALDLREALKLQLIGSGRANPSQFLAATQNCPKIFDSVNSFQFGMEEDICRGHRALNFVSYTYETHGRGVALSVSG